MLFNVDNDVGVAGECLSKMTIYYVEYKHMKLCQLGNKVRSFVPTIRYIVLSCAVLTALYGVVPQNLKGRKSAFNSRFEINATWSVLGSRSRLGEVQLTPRPNTTKRTAEKRDERMCDR